MVRITLALALSLLAVTSSIAHAGDDERVVEAQRHYEAGMASYHLEEYDQAISEWESGYRAKPAPQFLYNIAQAYRLSKRPDKALSFYQKYLKLDPNAANRPEVERHIAELTTIVESQRRAAERPSTQPLPPADSAPTTASAVPATTARADLTAAAPSRDRPLYKKGWFWGVVVGGAVLVAGGVTLGLVLGRGATSNEQTLPPARFN